MNTQPIPELEIDFTENVGPLRPELHSSGLGGQLVGSASGRTGLLKPLHFFAARTHDWALVNAGQRMIDTHFVFPNPKADPENPDNYFFGPTDEILSQTTQDLGLRVLYRMGTSIESVNARRDWNDPDAPKPGYYNCIEPDDWNHYANVLSHIIRHYTEGWNGGFHWRDHMRYWELWNEPNDRPGGSWLAADRNFDKEHNFARFRGFFTTVLKKLKTEFPDLKFGGPAVCYPDTKYLQELLRACKEAGYAPDFVSWHNYGCRPDDMLKTPAKMRALCDGLGFPETELVIDEWHYLPYPEAWGDFSAPPERFARLVDPINGLTGIESAVYTLQTFCGLQETCLDQSYWYGCNPNPGALWGIFHADGSPNKEYFAAKLFGTVVAACDRRAQTVDWDPRNPIQAYGYLSRDGKRKYVIVSRFKGGPIEFQVRIRGLGSLQPVSCLVLDRFHDLDEALDSDPTAKSYGNVSRTPFSPTVASPVFLRPDEETFVFRIWDPASSAYLIAFE